MLIPVSWIPWAQQAPMYFRTYSFSKAMLRAQGRPFRPNLNETTEIFAWNIKVLSWLWSMMLVEEKWLIFPPEMNVIKYKDPQRLPPKECQRVREMDYSVLGKAESTSSQCTSWPVSACNRLHIVHKEKSTSNSGVHSSIFRVNWRSLGLSAAERDVNWLKLVVISP